MSAALSDDHAFDECPAAAARLALLVIDAHMVIIVARLAPEIAVIVEGGATVFDTQGERRDNAFVQLVDLVRGKAVCTAQGMNTSGEECFIGINVTHPCHDALIEQGLLDTRLAPCQTLCEAFN